MTASAGNKSETSKSLQEQISCLTNQLAAKEQQLQVEQTSRQEAESALQLLQERYELASQAGHTGVWDIDLRTGSFYLAPSLRQLRGIAPDQQPTLAAFLTAVHPQDREKVSKTVGRYLRGKLDNYQIEHRNLLPDGSERWVTVHAVALRDQDGIPYRLVGTETDITEKRTAELALQEAQTELAKRVDRRTAALAQANNALKKEIARHEQSRDQLRQSEETLRRLHTITVDPATSYSQKVEKLLALGCDLLGVETGMLARVENSVYQIQYVQSPIPLKPGTTLPLDMTYCDLLLAIPPEDWPLTFVDIGQSEQAYHPAYQNFKLEAYMGLPIIVRGRPYGTLSFSTASSYKEPFSNTQKETIKLIGRWLASELERQQLENEFRQAQKMEAIGQLTSGVAHDLNNLLTIITGYSGLLTEPELGLTGSALRYAKSIHDTGHQVSELTNQLLAFSRAQEQELQVLQLNEALEKAKSMIDRLIGENIIILTDYDPNLGKIKADPVQINQVVVNLAVNARDAMPTGGQLLIETETVFVPELESFSATDLAPGHYAMLAISDTGLGMTPQVRAQIFEPFFTTKAKGQGTGLGLSTVYSIVTQVGGKLQVESELNQGTTFRLYFPVVADENEAPVAMIDLPSFSPVVKGNETILLVEDRGSVREFVLEVLTDAGYRVMDAEDGMQAVTLFNEYPDVVHLLLTDVIMPGMNGAELAAFLLDLAPELKVLYMSGYTDAISLKLDDNQPKHFLHKPFLPDDLLRAVRRALDVA